MAKKSGSTRSDVVGSDRQAKIDAAAKANAQGPNKILIGTVVAIMAIIAVVAGVIIADRSSRDEVTAQAQVPTLAAGMGEAFAVNSDVTLEEGAPTLDIYEDFRCPACHQAYAVFHDTVSDLAEQGRIELNYHFKTVIDSRGGDGSLKAASSAMCAADAGQFQEYHESILDQIMVNGGQQPNWGPDYFTQAAQQSGITGEQLTAFNECVADGRYDDYITSVNQRSNREGIDSTPQYLLNGERMDFGVINTPELFVQAVDAATGQ
ncbi:MAG: thioredoxin domain-containing protein [Actinomycetia bacterium]|nr:thioredoxin domain-containing protein [Actinomycetes bacterium]